MTVRVLVILLALTAVARAQPGLDPSRALGEANVAANAGNWAQVSAYVEPLVAQSLVPADLAEAHRLAGLAAFFTSPEPHTLAEEHFLAYLRIDLDGHLDPGLYPPEVVTFFEAVRSRHASELRARRPKAKNRYWVLNLIPPAGQFQNGERTKGYVLAAMLGTFLTANIASYVLVERWCFKQSRQGKESLGCDATSDHYASASALRSINITSGVAFLVTYGWGVYDGVRGYGRARREPALAPYASPTNGGAEVGLRMNF